MASENLSQVAPRLNGLVLAGGLSTRMGVDKAMLSYSGKPQAIYAKDLLEQFCDKVFVSIRSEHDKRFENASFIVDTLNLNGPINGILSAMKTAPECAWLVLACDLPLVSAEVLRKLLATRDSQKMATAYISKTNGLPEPMCAIYEPKFFHPMMRWIEAGKTCPRKMLIDSDVRLVELCNLNALDNANTQDDRIRLQGVLSGLECKDLRIRYFAAMKDATGRPAESIRSYARTAEELYQELNARYQFSLRHDLIKVAVNGALKSHDVVLNPGDEIVFIPPVAGG